MSLFWAGFIFGAFIMSAINGISFLIWYTDIKLKYKGNYGKKA